MQKKPIIVASAFVMAMNFSTSVAQAGPVKDWKDLDKVHKKVKHAIEDMGRARAANHYDMAGHGARAEDLLKQAERELQQAVEAARRNG